MKKKVYVGARISGSCCVSVSECEESNHYTPTKEYSLDPRFDCVNHSPDGFEWGYGGSGPAQLAFAILADLYDEKFAKKRYQEFKIRVVQSLPKESFTLTDEDIKSVMEEN